MRRNATRGFDGPLHTKPHVALRRPYTDTATDAGTDTGTDTGADTDVRRLLRRRTARDGQHSEWVGA
ncbi:MAG: hypothetical protein JRF42_06070 [Deltaproteobacteria bacterium]|nr:hypothetical protein [Deltaproteobacteria bacterium]